jgi:hypothetical protein
MQITMHLADLRNRLAEDGFRRIMSQSGVPMTMASIRVDGSRTSASSDENGYYKIALNPGQYRIDADKAGYGIPPRVVQVSKVRPQPSISLGKDSGIGHKELRSKFSVSTQPAIYVKQSQSTQT